MGTTFGRGINQDSDTNTDAGFGGYRLCIPVGLKFTGLNHGIFIQPIYNQAIRKCLRLLFVEFKSIITAKFVKVLLFVLANL